MRRSLMLVCSLALVACGGGGSGGIGDGGTGSDGSGGNPDGSGGGGDGSATGGDGSTTAQDATVDSPFHTDPSGNVICNDGEPCACDNGVDDDGDGLTDGLDPECTGAYDDDEGSFATGIPGDNIDFCQDCFFDGNSGMGDDGCAYHTDCIYGETPPGGGGADCFNCDVSQQCFDFCRPRTPNGCDCFGCCEVLTDGGEPVYVFLDANCSVDNIDDTEACPRCVQSDQCVNECGRCELCPGKEEEDLPDDCGSPPPPDGGTPQDGGTPPQDGGTSYTCDDGQQVCSETMPCPQDYYCSLGCCLPSLF